MRKFKKIMIANRGEIALRVIRSAHKLGISTLALVTRAEQNAQHARLADECHIIGEGEATKSYLNAPLLVETALKRGADAVHPGYGFLSENFDFVELVEKSKLKFIGPPSAAIRRVGNKKRAKELMEKNGIPLIPGYHGDSQDDQLLKAEAEKIGYPVMIKAAQGGGGKGMRLVQKASEFLAQLASARAEALMSFGADKVILERFVDNPKHIEVQILGDEHGNVFDFFERDCSVQRRHQKIIEEAPSGLDPSISKRIRQTAVRAAKAAGYANAGTVEFLFDRPSGEFYFMEVNSRLQVEHPVSEFVTGHDLVELQIRVAQGENLAGLKIPEQPRGHAIEARLCAEDPFNEFMPSPGTLTEFKFLNQPVTNSDYTMNFDLSKTSIAQLDGAKGRAPDVNDRKPLFDVKDMGTLHWQAQYPGDEIYKTNIRFDSGVITGSAITPYFDSMIGKVVVWGENRDAALQLLDKALRSIQVSGVQTTLPLLLRLLQEKEFRSFDYYLEYFKNHVKDLTQDPLTETAARLHLAAYAVGLMHGDLDFPAGLANFRLNSVCRKLFRFQLQRAFSRDASPNSATVALVQTAAGSNTYNAVTDFRGVKKTQVVEFVARDQTSVTCVIDGRIQKIELTEDKTSSRFYHEGLAYQIKDVSLESVFTKSKSLTSQFEASMDTKVKEMNVAAGQMVEAGTWLYSTFSMKIEYKEIASTRLLVKKVNFAKDDFVPKGSKIILAEEVSDPAPAKK